MKRNRKKIKKEQHSVTDPRDRKAERIVYAVIMILILFAVVMIYMMSQEFAGIELQENGHFKEFEKEK